MVAESFVGIDLHDTVLRVSLRNSEGKETLNNSIPTKCVEKVHKFFESLERPAHYAIESVGMYERLWDLLEPLNLERLVLANAAACGHRGMSARV